LELDGGNLHRNSMGYQESEGTIKKEKTPEQGDLIHQLAVFVLKAAFYKYHTLSIVLFGIIKVFQFEYLLKRFINSSLYIS